jgi:hypothetical protein
LYEKGDSRLPLDTYSVLSQAQLFVRGTAVDKLSNEPLELAIIRSVNTETNR